MKYEMQWRAALIAERGINAAQLKQTIRDALHNRNIPREEVLRAECAVYDSYRAFSAGNQEAALSHGQIAFERCNRLHTLLVLETEVGRDRASMKVRRRPRGSRMPLLDAWLTEKLKSGDVTCKVLWKSLPDHDDDEAKIFVWRDGDDCVYERNDTAVRHTSYKSFENRFTDARKARFPVSD